MTVGDLAHHLLLAAAAAGLLLAGDRVAAALGARGIPRVAGTAAVACALVVLETLLIGLVLDGSMDVALGLAAIATGLAARAALPAVPHGLGAAWAARGAREQAALGAGAMLFAGWCAWQLRHPHLGTDGVTYHLGLAGAWAQDAAPGGIVGVIDGVPIANYPVTNEVALSWAITIARAWTPVSLWTPALLVLLLLSGWSVLRGLRVPRALAGLGLAAYALQPLVLTQTGTPLTDVAAAAWLAVTAALVVAAREQPRLLALALVSAGLSFGTKTTPALLLAGLIAFGLWTHRARLRPLVPHLGAGLLVAFLVGGLWPLRNLVDHGSPLWPFVAGPGGDPVPAAFAPYDTPFLQHPGEMLDGRTADYLTLLSGGTLLLLGGLLLWLVPRSRPAMVAAGVALLAMLTWANAPYTGITKDTSLAVGAVRYLLPAMAAATVAICVAGRDARPARLIAYGLLGLSALVSVARTWQLGFPYVPAASTVVALLVVGALAVLAARRSRPGPRVRRGGAVALAALLVLGAAGSVDGYVGRHADSGVGDGGIAKAVEARAGDRDVVMSPATVAILRGDRLQRRVTLVPPDCARLRGRLVVLQPTPPTPQYARARRCLGRPVYADPTYELFDGR